MNNLIQSVVIPNYADKVQTARAIRPIYYVSATSNVKGKKKIPQSFLNSPKYGFDSKGILIDLATGEPKLANPKKAGNPRYWVVNFQDVWNQNIVKVQRAVIVHKLEDLFRPHIQKFNKVTKFPVEICTIIYDSKCPVDISNRGGIYTKIIEDLLVREGIIPNDTIEYVNCSGRIKFIEVDEEDKRMEIRIYESDNKPF